MTTGDLSQASRKLLELMSRLWYGHIEDLRIEKGEPVLSPALRVVAEIKLGQSEKRWSRKPDEPFQLKAQHVELLELFRRLNNGRIERLEVQAGLPFRIACADLGLVND